MNNRKKIILSLLLACLFGTNTWTMNDLNEKNCIDDRTGTFSIRKDDLRCNINKNLSEYGDVNFWGTAYQQKDKNSFAHYNFKFTANKPADNFYCIVENYIFDSSGNLETKKRETKYTKKEHTKNNGRIAYIFPYIFEVLKSKNNKQPYFKLKITKQQKPKPRRWFSLKNMFFSAGITTGALGVGYLAYKYLWGKK